MSLATFKQAENSTLLTGVEQAANKVAHKIVPRIEYLFDRWQDERKYEDFADYEKAAENECLLHEGVIYKELVEKLHSRIDRRRQASPMLCLVFHYREDITPKERYDTWVQSEVRIRVNAKEVSFDMSKARLLEPELVKDGFDRGERP